MSVHGAKASLASLAASSPTLFGTPSRREESWQGYDPEFPSSPLPGRQSAGTSDYYIHGSFAASPGAKALRPFKDSSSVGRRSTERDSVSPSFPTSSRLFERRIVGAMGAAPTELECCRPTRASMRKQLLYHDVVDPTKLRVELWSMPEPDLRERALRENVDRGALEEVGDTWKEGIINLILEKHRAVAVQQPHAKSQLVVPTHAGKGFDNKRLGRHAHRWFSAPHHISQSMHHNGSLLKKHTVHSEMTVHGSEPRAHNKFVQVHREPNTLDTFPLRNVEEMRVQIDRRDPRPDSVYTVGEGGSKVALRHVCWTGTDHDDPQGRHSKQRKPRVPCLAEQDSVTKLSFATHVRRSCMDPSYAFEPGARYTSGQSRRPAKKQTESLLRMMEEGVPPAGAVHPTSCDTVNGVGLPRSIIHRSAAEDWSPCDPRGRGQPAVVGWVASPIVAEGLASSARDGAELQQRRIHDPRVHNRSSQECQPKSASTC